MPEFNTYVDVDVYEFIDECSKSEINELIDDLIDRGYLSKNSKVGGYLLPVQTIHG